VADEPGERGGWEWPPPPISAARNRLAAVIWPGLFLFYLAQPVIEAIKEPHPLGYRVAVVAIVLLYSLSYLATMAIGHRSSKAFKAGASAWLFMMPILLAVFLGADSLVFWTYAIAAGLILLPRNIGMAVGLASAVALLVTTAIETGDPNWGNAMILVVMTVAMVSFTALNQTVMELRLAQARVADLAVAEERSRLARDLHDVLGHSLTTITLKAGLARRVLQASGDRNRAIDEISDVEHLSRQALTEVRATVSGYRTASLPAELVGARAALRAAQISADLPHAVDNVPVTLQEPFAYVLREGVTNVIRHSGATRCEVRLGDSWIEIRDDGRPAEEPAVRNGQRGHGLTGLAERLAPLGGTVDAGPVDDGGFRLRATVPIPELT
jgi:two-component system sensor histidine kinase DesK